MTEYERIYSDLSRRGLLTPLVRATLAKEERMTDLMRAIIAREEEAMP
jgi:hypothetical protein